MAPEIAELIDAYFSGELDQAGAQTLRNWLRADPQHYEYLAKESRLEYALHRVYQARRLQDVLDTDELYAEHLRDAEDGERFAFAELSRLEEQAQASLVQMHHIKRPWYAGGWVVGVGSLAAVLALALVLVYLMTNPGQTNGPINIASPAPADAWKVEQLPVVVATLASENNTRWQTLPGQTPPRVGDNLYAGQRLSLVSGTAELMTSRGTIATLNAPCTVEMLNNGNAVYLHSGRLDGLVEGRVAKGFLVRTPLFDVVDVGTRFSVEMQSDRPSQVEVKQGRVELTLRDADGHEQIVPLTKNETARVDGSLGQMILQAPYSIDLKNTGAGLKLGDLDRSWQVANPNSNNPDRYEPATAVIDGTRKDWENDPAVSSWLSLPGQDGFAARFGSDDVLWFRHRFTLPDDVDPESVRVELRFVADDYATIFVNDQQATQRFDQNAEGKRINVYHTFQSVTLDKHFKPGLNEIAFKIDNLEQKNQSPLGLRVEFLTARASRTIQLSPAPVGQGEPELEGGLSLTIGRVSDASNNQVLRGGAEQAKSD